MRNKDNLTPLHSACVGGNKEVVQYLVEELKCDVGEFLCACMVHVTTKVYLQANKKISSDYKGSCVRWVGQWDYALNSVQVIHIKV